MILRLPLATAARRFVACALIGAACAVYAQPKQSFISGSGPDELWDITLKMELVGMPMAMPAQAMQICVKPNRTQEDLIPRQDNCTRSNVRSVGNKTTFSFTCTEPMPMTGSGEMTATPTSYAGKMEMKSTKKGEEMQMNQTFSGRKVGACTAK